MRQFAPSSNLVGVIGVRVVMRHWPRWHPALVCAFLGLAACTAAEPGDASDSQKAVGSADAPPVGETPAFSGESTSSAPTAATGRYDPEAVPTDKIRLPVPSRDVRAFPSDHWGPQESTECSRRLPAGEPAGHGSVTVYFSCEPKNGPYLYAAAARRIPARATPLADAIEALLAGPTRDERRAGFLSTFGSATADIPFTVEVDKRVAIVDFHRTILDVEFAFVGVSEVAQIVSTAGQFPTVDAVDIQIGGEPLCRATGEC